MITNVSQFLEAIGRSMSKAGIVPFFQQEYPGRKIEPLTPFDVGVIAGYLPHKAALFSCNVRFHPGGPDLFQYVHLHISSQHQEEVRMKQLSSELIVRNTDELSWNGISYHQLPIYGLDGYYSDWLYHTDLSIDDADYPIEVKVEFVYDIFYEFVSLYGDTLVERFTENPRFEAVPFWSVQSHQVLEDVGNRIREAEVYFFHDMLGKLTDELVEDPVFPLPPVNTGIKTETSGGETDA